MNNSLKRIAFFLIFICFITLPFHWVPSESMVIPKKNLSFNRTIVTKDDVHDIVDKYYLGSPIEKMEVAGDPLTYALKDRWKVTVFENNDIEFQHLK